MHPATTSDQDHARLAAALRACASGPGTPACPDIAGRVTTGPAGAMTSPRRRKNAIILPIPRAAEPTALPAALDELIRSSPRTTAELAAFLASRGAPFPGSGAGNLTGELPLTALGFGQLPAAGEDTSHQESPCHHPTR